MLARAWGLLLKFRRGSQGSLLSIMRHDFGKAPPPQARICCNARVNFVDCPSLIEATEGNTKEMVLAKHQEPPFSEVSVFTPLKGHGAFRSEQQNIDMKMAKRKILYRYCALVCFESLFLTHELFKVETLIHAPGPIHCKPRNVEAHSFGHVSVAPRTPKYSEAIGENAAT